MSATTPTTVSHSPSIVQAHAPAERLARTTRKVFAHDALADDRHFRRVRRVPCGELASRQQRNPHGLEIARVDLRRAGIERRLRLTLDLEVALDEHHAERRRVDQARGLHARQVLDAIEHAARERLDALGLVVEAFGQRHPDGLHDAVAPARFEAGRHRRETHEAVNQQARADQEDERHRDLRGDQQRPQPLALTVARRARCAGVQREAFAKRGPADAQRRHEADQQRRDERQAEAERHHARVDHDAAEAWQHGLRHERQRDVDRDLREHHAERRAHAATTRPLPSATDARSAGVPRRGPCGRTVRRGAR